MKFGYKRIFKTTLLVLFFLYIVAMVIPNYKILMDSSNFITAVVLGVFGMSTAFAAPTKMDKEVYEDLPWLPKLYFCISLSIPFISSAVILWKHYFVR